MTSEKMKGKNNDLDDNTSARMSPTTDESINEKVKTVGVNTEISGFGKFTKNCKSVLINNGATFRADGDIEQSNKRKQEKRKNLQ